MKVNKIFLSAAAVLFISSAVTAVLFSESSVKTAVKTAVKTPVKAPEFSVRSGDKKTITLSELTGSVIVLFYEAKGTAGKNTVLKKELTDFRNNLAGAQKSKLRVLGVADCSAAARPFIGMYEKALIDKTNETGFMVYGDWDGKMRDNYKCVKNEANFIIIDIKGFVRYQGSGKIADSEIDVIKKLITAVLSE